MNNIPQGKIVIFDFEVFRHDVLLGAIALDNGAKTVYQTWNRDEICDFYSLNSKAIWIGHNNERYDNPLLDAILSGKDPYQTSCSLIREEKRRRPRLSHSLIYMDLMKLGSRSFYSLKMTEGACGKNISETEVDFDIQRPLTDEEKRLTESYNRDDLNQTYENFLSLHNEIAIRIDLCREFGIPYSHLSDTEAQLGAIVLGAKKNWDVETEAYALKPKMYPQLQVKNQQVIDFYLNQDYEKGKKLNVVLCGTEHTLANGGIHAAKQKYHCDEALYFDVSGYYNLVMINFDLLPRTLDEKGRERYIYCYKEQLRLKKINPQKRAVYKKVLLAVYGGEKNKYTDFYDPYKGVLVTITGQMFLVDLLEKLEGKAEVVQSNTDGIIVKVTEGHTKEEVISVVEEWEKRTGFTIKKVPIFNIWQRDVNCYMYNTEDGKLHICGEDAVYEDWDDIFHRGTWAIKEPPILAYCVVDFLENGVLPEETVERYKTKLRMYQYLCKKDSFDYLEYVETSEDGKTEIQKKRLQNVNRAFPWKHEESTGMVYKCKNEGKRAKVTSLPDSVFVYDDEILSDEAVQKLIPMIDYSYYVKRGYEKIRSFLPDEIAQSI